MKHSSVGKKKVEWIWNGAMNSIEMTRGFN